MRGIVLSLFLIVSTLYAEQPEFEMTEDGFAVIQTFSLTQGKICRALPQTIAHDTMELKPGNYQLAGSDIRRVRVFLKKAGE